MILPGLAPEEQRSLILSVGTHKRQREKSPIEVAELMKKARDNGATPQQIAESCQLSDTSMVSRFLRLLTLPEMVRDWVAWQPNNSELSLSTAQEIARLRDSTSQLRMAQLVLENRLNSKEVGHAVMRMERAKESPDSAVNAITKLRLSVRKRFVFIATVTDNQIRAQLRNLDQAQRNGLLSEALHRLRLNGMNGTLGINRFTLVADEQAAKGHTADSLEASIVPLLGRLLT